MWNIAHNLGGFLAPLLAGTAAKLYGWRFGMFAPGAVGLAMALFVAFAVRDSPEAAGFPPVEAPAAVEAANAASAVSGTSAAAEPLAVEKKEESLVDLLVNDVLKNPYVVGLALTYFFIYVVRQGVTSWFVFYLMQVRRCVGWGEWVVGWVVWAVGGCVVWARCLGGRLCYLLAFALSERARSEPPQIQRLEARGLNPQR
jgi:sugar phosphate permease